MGVRDLSPLLRIAIPREGEYARGKREVTRAEWSEARRTRLGKTTLLYDRRGKLLHTFSRKGAQVFITFRIHSGVGAVYTGNLRSGVNGTAHARSKLGTRRWFEGEEI